MPWAWLPTGDGAPPPAYEAPSSNGLMPGHGVALEPRWNFFLAGVGTFGGLYASTVAIGFSLNRDGRMAIPIAGPIMAGAPLLGGEGPWAALGNIVGVLAIADGVGQAVGLGFAIAGLSAQRPALVHVGASTRGLSLSGRF